MANLSYISAVLILLSLCHSSYQQYWKNDKIVKEWLQPAANSNSKEIHIPNAIPINLNSESTEKTATSSMEKKLVPAPYHGGVSSAELIPPIASNNFNHGHTSLMNEAKQYSMGNNNYPKPAPYNPPVVYNPPPVYSYNYNPPAYPTPSGYGGSGGYPIQVPGIDYYGSPIIENLLAGIPFNCYGLPTGHYRDTNFCDVFHACVYGMQRKTYACPVVGTRTYFDETTRRCEFVDRNPYACNKAYYY